MSIGAALLPESGVEPHRLLRHADLALYCAKADGRRTFRLFSPDMEAQLHKRRALESDLRRAIAMDELEIVYQPLLNLRSNIVVGFEALLRWKHPSRGYVPPSEFIPIAEEIGIIDSIGAWVLTHACMQAATWPESIKLAVNLSPVQFKAGDVVADVIDALRFSRLSACRLELEITESVLMEDTLQAGDALKRLKALGISIALDDFGTGYSSLNYLRKFPFDKIKIDQSFVQEMHKSPDCATIVRAVLMLANELGMVTTAEGVETGEQLEMLKAEGCTEAQGYLISRPVGGDVTHQLLNSLRLQAVA